MPKAKITKLCAFLVAALAVAGVSNAQPVLGDMINRTKAMKQRQAQSGGASGAVMMDDGVQNMSLWSISGINNTLYAEIWQGDAIHRLQLKPGASLPSGWRVVSADRRSVTLKLGDELRKLYPTAPGSTGWEFAQTPRVAVSTSAPAPAGANMAAARIAASNLPPMMPMNPSGQAMSTAPVTPTAATPATPAIAPSIGGAVPSAR